MGGLTMPKLDPVTVIGKISYTNAWPVFYHVDAKKLDFPARIVAEVPSFLNAGMQNGDIHIGALSSFAYAEAAEDLWLLPDLSVSADGRVNSILLFSRGPLESLKNGRIALTNTSATSVNLLKILMQKSLGAAPSYVTMEPDLDSMMENCDAALLIGDQAIMASWANKKYHVTDLGAWWKEWTGCSMTFAVWAVNRRAAEERPEAIARIADMFISSKQQSQADLSPIIMEAISRIGGTREYWSGYFNNLSYDLDGDKLRGLQLYLQYAYELRLLKHKVKPELWSSINRMQVNE